MNSPSPASAVLALLLSTTAACSSADQPDPEPFASTTANIENGPSESSKVVPVHTYRGHCPASVRVSTVGDDLALGVKYTFDVRELQPGGAELAPQWESTGDVPDAEGVRTAKFAGFLKREFGDCAGSTDEVGTNVRYSVGFENGALGVLVKLQSPVVFGQLSTFNRQAILTANEEF